MSIFSLTNSCCSGYTTTERRWIRPTLEVVGLKGGFQGEGIKTVLPSKALAKLSCRLVPGQDPETVWNSIEAHVSSVAPLYAPGLDVKLTPFRGGKKAYVANRNSVYMKLAGDVLDAVYETKHYVYGEGGSVPVTTMIYEALNVETVSLAFGLLDERNHAPDERFRMSELLKGQRSYIRMIMKLAVHLSKVENSEL